jgi:hypothetical protein
MSQENDNQVAASIAALAAKMYLIPHADAFKPTFSGELVAQVADAVKTDNRESGEVERLRRALANIQLRAGELAEAAQQVRGRDDDQLITVFAEGRNEMPAYDGGALTEQYSRLLQCLNTLATGKLPRAYIRAVRGRGAKLVAGSRLLSEFARQRLAWSNFLLGPVQEFEGGGVALELIENGVPVSESGRLRRLAGQMFAAGSALTQQADDAERSGGSVTFEPHLGNQYDWLFSVLDKAISGQSEPAVEE